MRTSKNLVIIGLVVLVAVFLAAPSAFAKKKLADDELDLITAAGEPTIVQSTSGSISFSDDADAVLSFDTDVQTAVTGLVINNLSGENQIATAINIASVVFVVGPSQTNSITQSWGATKDITAVSVAPVSVSVAGVTAAIATASSAAETGGDATATSAQTTSNSMCSSAPGGGEVKCAANKQAPAGNNLALVRARGGDAAAAAAAAASTSAASGAVAVSEAKIAALSMYADQIIESTGGGDVFVTRQITPALTFDNGAQANLSALVLNNVAGLNQAANAINILSGGIAFGPLGISASQQDFGTSSQSNTIIQYRGTPLSRPEAPIK